jgi:hypothetical protein
VTEEHHPPDLVVVAEDGAVTPPSNEEYAEFLVVDDLVEDLQRSVAIGSKVVGSSYCLSLSTQTLTVCM